MEGQCRVEQHSACKSIYLLLPLQQIRRFSHGTNLMSIPPRDQDIVEGATRRVKGVLVDFMTPIVSNIGVELTIEALIYLHRLISEKAASVASNLRGGRNGHLVLTMAAEEYMEQMGYTFVIPHNPGKYPPTMETTQ